MANVATPKLVTAIGAAQELLVRKEASLKEFTDDRDLALKHASTIARQIHDVVADPAISVESIQAKLASHAGTAELLADVTAGFLQARRKLAMARGVNLGKGVETVPEVKQASDRPPEADKAQTYHPGILAMADRLGVGLPTE